MQKIRKILVPTDFSDCSTPAVLCAAKLGRSLAAEILVLHVTEAAFDYQGYGLSADAILQTQQDLRTVIEDKLGEVREMLEGCENVSLHTREGRAHEQIVEMAKDSEADLIVLSTHGRSGLQHLWLGSVTERVVRTAHCPVLTVRPRSEP